MRGGKWMTYKELFGKKYKNGNETFDQWVQRVSGGNPKVAKLIKQKNSFLREEFLHTGGFMIKRSLIPIAM